MTVTADQKTDGSAQIRPEKRTKKSVVAFENRSARVFERSFVKIAAKSAKNKKSKTLYKKTFRTGSFSYNNFFRIDGGKNYCKRTFRTYGC